MKGTIYESRKKKKQHNYVTVFAKRRIDEHNNDIYVEKFLFLHFW